MWEWHLLRITRSAATNAQQSKACAYSSNDRTRTTAAMAAALGIGRLFNAVRSTGCWFNFRCSIGKEFRQRDKHRRLRVQLCRTRSTPHLLPAPRRQKTHAAEACKHTHAAASGITRTQQQQAAHARSSRRPLRTFLHAPALALLTSYVTHQWGPEAHAR